MLLTSLVKNQFGFTYFVWIGNNNVLWIYASVYSYIPLSLLIVLNSLILYSVLRASKRRQHVRTSNKHNSNRKITKMLVTVSLAFFITTTPLYTWIVLKNIDLIRTVNMNLLILLSTLRYANHGINFFLYTLTNETFCRELYRMCARKPRSNRARFMNKRPLKTSTELTLASRASVQTEKSN